MENESRESFESRAKQVAELFQSRGVKVESILERLASFQIETPSWGYCRGGTRFGAYPNGREAMGVEQKIAHAGMVHRFTGCTPKVALHFPWDGRTDGDMRKIESALKANGLKAGAINSNTFSVREEPLDFRLRYGSLTNPLEEVRRGMVAHHGECVRIMKRLGSRVLSFWLADGTNSPGQMSFFDQYERVNRGLTEIYGSLDGDATLLVEYKLYEPGFYSTAIADWGRALDLCLRLGEQAKVLVDLGHHSPGTNIEQIAAHLISLGRLGGFHFNDKKYGDDDLATGSIDPFQLFRIFHVLVEGEEKGLFRLEEISFMIDQSPNIRNPVCEMVESVENILRTLAQALLVDWRALQKVQREAKAERSDRILMSAFRSPWAETLLEMMRREKGLPLDPLASCLEELGL